MRHIVDEFGQGFLALFTGAVLYTGYMNLLKSGGLLYEAVLLFLNRICGN